MTNPAALQTLPDPAVLAVSRAVLAKHAKTFRLASWLLTPTQRDEAAVVYAFCRLVDDTVDEAPDAQQARTALSALEEELAGRAPGRPLIATFRGLCARRGIPLGAAHALIRGVESDLGEVLLEDDRALLRYCYRVAGTVGLMMCGVIGVTQEEALPHAIDLGIAMQLTNICRDVLEDSRRGRVYLPAWRLEAAGATQAQLLAGQADARAVGVVVQEMLALAERYYQSGHDGMRYIPPRARAAIAAAARMYRAIGLRILARGCRVLEGRTVVPGPSKALWLVRALAWSWGAARGPVVLHDATLHPHLEGLPGCHPGAG